MPKYTRSQVLAVYKQIKGDYPDGILLMRLGDFYDAFGPDAEQFAELAGVNCRTISLGGKDLQISGVPYFAVESYIKKVLAHGVIVVAVEPTGQYIEERVVKQFNPGGIDG